MASTARSTARRRSSSTASSVYRRSRRSSSPSRPTYVTFDASVEAHLRLGVDPRHADQMVRGTVVLPHGTGKVVRVAVFAQGEKAQEALRAGADEVGGEDLVKKIEAGWLEFDVALATPDSMGLVGKLGKILGRRGLMPNPKAGHDHLRPRARRPEVKGGRVEFKVDKAGDRPRRRRQEQLRADRALDNLAALVDAVNRAKPAGAKGQYLKALTIASTMGPGIRVDVPGVLARRGRLTRAATTGDRRSPARGGGREARHLTMTDGPPQTACARGPRSDRGSVTVGA